MLPTSTTTAPREASARDAIVGTAYVFDACTASVIGRTVLLVEVLAAIAVGFIASGPGEWFFQLALITAVVLPACLLWLALACHQKKQLQRFNPVQQYLAGAALGALCGLLAALLYQWATMATHVAWLTSTAAGGFIAAMVVMGLQLRAQARAPAATTARLAELQARIRPHFLFNALNSAISLVQDQPQKAETMLEDLSDLFRHALTEQRDISTLAEEVTLAQRYLSIEQVRFGDRMEVQWDLDSRSDNAAVPPLFLQPLVENAVKHGVEPSHGNGRIRIATRRRGNRVYVQITNTMPRPYAAPPPDRRPGTGTAIANVKKRLRLLYDLECDFQATGKDGYYTVRISFPA